MHPLGGLGPLMWVLFGENICENERIGSHSGGHAPGMPTLDPPMQIDEVSTWLPPSFVAPLAGCIFLIHQ